MNTVLDEQELAELDALERALTELDETIVAAEVVEVSASSDDPMSRMDMDALLGGAFLLKGDQVHRTFQKGKEIFRNHEVVAAEREARARNKDKLRKRIARQRTKRAAIETERMSKPLDHTRMVACMALVGNLAHVVADLTMQRYNRFRRTLGDVLVEDIAQDAIIAIAEAMARTDTDIVSYAESVLWLKDAPQPFNTADGPEGAGRLLGTIIRVVGSTIVKTYREAACIKTWTLTVGDEGKDVWVARNTTVESLDMLITITANTGGDIDTLIAKHKASGKPKHKGSAPGMRDKRLFARNVIDAAIEARGLGWLASMLLDDECKRTDGTFKWTENADAVWAGFGFPPMTTDDRRLKAEYARKATRLAFEFLPRVIAEVYELIESPELMWEVGALSDYKLVEVVQRVRQHFTGGYELPMDAGASLDMTMRMIDDPAFRALSLACIITAESDDQE